MGNAPDLHHLGRKFANDLKDLLSDTVYSDRLALEAIVVDDRRTDMGKLVYVATDLDRVSRRSQPIKLRSSSPFVRTGIWLDLSCHLSLDEEGFLAVQSSFWVISIGEARSGLTKLLHYDFERDKAAHNESHVQVCAKHEPLEDYPLCGNLGGGRMTC